MSKVEAIWREHEAEFVELAACATGAVMRYEAGAVTSLRAARLAASRMAEAPDPVGSRWRARAAILDAAYRDCGFDAWDGPRD